MADRFKIAYIGAGSFRFSLGFFMDICRAKELMPMEIALCDTDAKSLDIMTKIMKRMVKKAATKIGADIIVNSSVDRSPVLENADFVYKSIAVGIQHSDWFDNYLPVKFGIMQNTGDTVGPGGLFRGLRTAPIGAAIAKDMKKLCPKAPLLNYTNPQATIVMAARTVAPDVQYIGLCHELFGGMKTVQKFANEKLGKSIPKWEFMDVEYGGVNHFAWITKVGYQGEDFYPKLREHAHNLVREKFGGRGFNFYLLEKYGYFPYPGSRHVAEFMFEYYNYFNNEIQAPYWSFPVVRNVPQLDKARRGAYWGFRQMARWLPVPGPHHGGEKAMDMTIDWKFDNPTHHVVNIPNNGLIPELPSDSTVEVPAIFKGGKLTPVGTIHLPENVAELVRPHAEQHRFTVNAALGNDLETVRKAMRHDPMAAFIEDDDKLDALTDLMLYYEQEWLPAEWKDWIPKKEDLEKSKYWVAPKDLVVDGKEYLKVKFPPNPDLKKKAFFWTEN
jgi:alpha-galactosidase